MIQFWGRENNRIVSIDVLHIITGQEEFLGQGSNIRNTLYHIADKNSPMALGMTQSLISNATIVTRILF